MDNRNVDTSPGWETRAMHKLLGDMVTEQRRRRRWSIFFKLLILLVLLLLFSRFLMLVSSATMGRGGARISAGGSHTAMVSLIGEIADGRPASADNIIRALNNAFSDHGTKGVILRINSPGGSPTQSSIINAEISRLRELYPSIPIYAVAEDICASGSYMVAVATNRIFVNRASIVGSIGVVINGFGFTGTMEKLGVERRLMIAGKNKGFLDPFSPRNLEQEKFVQTMLEDIHQQFITLVEHGRGDRLKGPKDQLYSGLAWTGAESVQLGLADNFGSVNEVARNVIRAEDIVDYTIQENLLNRLGASVGTAMARQLERVMTATSVAPNASAQ